MDKRVHAGVCSHCSTVGKQPFIEFETFDREIPAIVFQKEPCDADLRGAGAASQAYERLV
jgi:hypothetical protein